jgi:hypothetical protein
MTSMTPAATMPQAMNPTMPRDTGLPGLVAALWCAAGGFLTGGFLVGVLALTGRTSGSGMLLTSAGLFLVGAMLGFAHGAALGFFGRPAGMTALEAFGSLGMGAVYAVPVVIVGGVVAGWAAMLSAALYAGSPIATALSALAWVAGLVILAAAGRYGWTALRNAFARWPERRAGTALSAATFAALFVALAWGRPVLWGVPLRLTEAGAVLVALALSVWVAGPVVTLALRAASRLREGALAGDAGTGRVNLARVAGSIALGLLAGALLAAAALPFFASLRVPLPGVEGGMFAAAASRALIDEVFLRLLVVSAVAWMVLRLNRTARLEAGIIAVTAGALAQVAVYLPWMAGIGFPSAATALGFAAVAVIAPALVLGTLYWTRGLTASLTANAASILLLALLVT